MIKPSLYIRNLAFTVIANTFLLCQTLSCIANEKKIVKLDLHSLSTEGEVKPEPFSDFPLILPSVVVSGEGNHVLVSGSLPNGANDSSGKAILLEKVVGAGRVSFSFGWPAYSLPNVGAFETRLDLRFLKVEGESGNLMISLYSESKAIAVLQIAKSGGATLIAIHEDGTAISQDVGKFPLDATINNLVIRLDYDTGRLSLLLDGEPGGAMMEFNAKLAPNIIAVSSSTDRSSMRSMAIFNITADHEMPSK